MASFVRSTKEHKAADDRQISFSPGAIIQVTHAGNEHWGTGFVVQLNGNPVPPSKPAFFPKATVEPCGPPQASTDSGLEKKGEGIPMDQLAPPAAPVATHEYMTMDISDDVHQQKKVSTRVWNEPEFSICECGVTMFFGLLTLPCFCTNCMVIQDYERGVKLRHGRQIHAGTIAGGMHYLIPNVDKVLKIDVREKALDIPKQTVVTKEGLGITVDGVVRYKVFDASAAILDVANVHRCIEIIAVTKLREILALHTYAEIQLERLTLAKRLKRILDEASDPWGVDVLSVELTDLTLPHTLQLAMNAEQEAKRNATNNLVAARSRREIQLVDAHGAKEASIVQADGQAKSVVIDAKAKADAKMIEAEAEMKSAVDFARAAEIMNEAPLAIQLQYLQTLSTIAKGPSKTSMVPFNSNAGMMAPLMASMNRN
jgi:regulator of protease activity HflC (stomatin/prohibitin superfamily)